MNVLMLLDNAYKGDPRVSREVSTLLKKGINIRLVCMSNNELPVHEQQEGLSIFRIIEPMIFDIKNRAYPKEIANKIESDVTSDFTPDVIHCHDHTMLNLGVILKKRFSNVTLIYDSHELFYSFPLMNDHFLNDPMLYFKSWVVRRLQNIREARNIRQAEEVITVNDSIATLLKKRYQLKAIPHVLRNVPVFRNVEKKRGYYQEKYNIGSDQQVLLFITGKLHKKGHNLNQVIEELGNMEGVHLVIIGEGLGRVDLQDKVEKNELKNIHFHDKVPAGEILDFLTLADFGLLPFWNKRDLSYWYALPNKLFEYIMANLPVLSTIQPEYRKIVDDFNIGVVVNPDKRGDFANGMKELMKNKEQLMPNIERAKEQLNWDKEATVLEEIYKSQMSQKS